MKGCRQIYYKSKFYKGFVFFYWNIAETFLFWVSIPVDGTNVKRGGWKKWGKGTGRGVSAILEGILDNLLITTKVKNVNNEMRYTFGNKKAEELFEYSAKEAID